MCESFLRRLLCSRAFVSLLTLGALAANGGLAGAEFVPGRIYAAAVYGDREYRHLPPILWEFDPATGQSRKFATLPNPPYGSVVGLRFTPDGHYLRMTVPNRNEMLEMDGSGQFRVVLDADDGLGDPTYMDYNRSGDLFVNNGATREILRFPADGGPPTVFAGRPWVQGTGQFAVAPGGEVYYHYGYRNIIRFEADGRGSQWLYDDMFLTNYLLTDGASRLFFYNSGGEIYRFENGDPNTRTLLTQIYSARTGRLALSADQKTLYAVNFLGVWAVDPETGVTRGLGRWPEEAFYYPYWGPTDVALFIPEPITIHGALVLLLSVVGRWRSESPSSCRRSAPCRVFGSGRTLSTRPRF